MNLNRISVTLVCVLSLAAGTAWSAEAPPNVLIFIADDMTYHDLGCWGNEDVKTPHLDRLAGQGMRLERCFTPAPTCSPTRHALYTGLFPVKSGAHPNHAVAKPGTRSLPHYLTKLGYRVGLIGKTHIGPTESYPFEILGGKLSLSYDTEEDPAAEKIEEFISRDPDQPYCLVVASNEPHEPWSKGDPSAYNADELMLPPYFVDTPETRKALTRYYAEITHMDEQVGRCMEIVDGSGQAENTLFLFLSEQGSSFPHCKWTLYDTGIRAAGIARWPAKVRPGSRSQALVQYVDIVPTLVESAGGEPIEGVDGQSFLGVLTGKADRHRDHVYAVQTSRGIINGPVAYGIRCVRDDRFKYILNLNADSEFSNMVTGRHPVFRSWRERAETDPFAREQVRRYIKRPPVEFYDLETDPYEMTNLADRPEHRERMAALREKLDSWMREQEDQGAATEMAALQHMTPGSRQRFERQMERQQGEWNQGSPDRRPERRKKR